MQPAKTNAPEPGGIWRVPECPISVVYSAGLLDALRLAVLEAFYAFPRGGLEIGGVLFGIREENRVHIKAWRDVACEHAFGASFVLSENDRARLAVLLRPPGTDPALHGLVPVGWFHSHTRSEIFLSAQDLEIHERHFPEPWQVALVLRPSLSGTRAGFFARDAAGNLRADASYHVFTVTPLSGRALTRAERPAADPAPAGEPSPASETPDPAPVPAAPPKAALTAQGPAFIAPPSLALTEPRRPYRRWPWALPVTLLVSGAAVYATRSYWLDLLPQIGVNRTAAPLYSNSRPEPVELEAFDHGGQVQIRWNKLTPAVRRARGGSLDIRDGGSRTMLMLEPERLLAGTVTYVRQTERVEVRLELEQPDGVRVSQFASFIGKTPEPPTQSPAATDELRSQRDELRKQLLEARTQLVNQSLLLQKLQQVIRDMQASRVPAPPQNGPSTLP